MVQWSLLFFGIESSFTKAKAVTLSIAAERKNKSTLDDVLYFIESIAGVVITALLMRLTAEAGYAWILVLVILVGQILEVIAEKRMMNQKFTQTVFEDSNEVRSNRACHLGSSGFCGCIAFLLQFS